MNETLAQVLYVAWCGFRQRETGVVGPRWFALRDDRKEHWRTVAAKTLEVYEL